MSNKMADLLLSCCKLIITTLFLLVHLQKMILAKKKVMTWKYFRHYAQKMCYNIYQRRH